MDIERASTLKKQALRLQHAIGRASIVFDDLYDETGQQGHLDKADRYLKVSLRAQRRYQRRFDCWYSLRNQALRSR